MTKNNNYTIILFIIHIQFSDPYDAYLYQSYHITTPVVTPTLLFPTDTQPSYISTRHTAEQLFRLAAVRELIVCEADLYRVLQNAC